MEYLIKNMKLTNKLIAVVSVAFTFCAVSVAATLEAPDALIRRISEDVIETAKADQEIQSGNQRRVLDLVESKILPHVDFQAMTAQAAGRFWREATPEQQRQLAAEFRALLVFTYSGALSQIKNETLEFKPLRAGPADTDVEVRTQVVPARGERIPLNYSLKKTPSGWQIVDINVFGAWLVETYKGNFSAQIAKSGIDGLIKALSDKNKKLAAKLIKVAKSS